MTALRGAGPLAAFLAAGLVIYFILDLAGFGARDDPRIRVDAAALDTFVAARGGQAEGATFASLSEAERRAVLDDYLREEALYREAVALGLDRGDTAIRRRLVQSLRFSLESEVPDAEDPGDEVLREWFAANRGRYFAGDRISFVHVYFDKHRRGAASAQADARAVLRTVGKSDWFAMGDRFAHQRSYSDLPRDALGAQWGEGAAERIFNADQPAGQWFGPVESEWGFHLVRIDRRQERKVPDFADVRAAVLADWQRDQRERRVQDAVDRIVESYPVTMSSELDGLRK